ncbi:hypothetical protein [Riemerella columbina]|uniref:hypothetical protein n=1 Tax=Riemerella columbina TaxID=103810 RepID=UPI0026702A26|nr:hypothetical protein [Riemerella columbina]WKS95102.1 hypothetical protein NYR17_09315 [Riemerella columbina]
MDFLRNTIGVLLGLAVAGLIITFGIRLNPSWISGEAFSPFEQWERVLFKVRHQDSFFVVLLFSSGIAATVGGVVTAIVVKYAKVAYAILIGFILLFLAMLDVMIFPYHPTFYKIAIFLIFFPFSWLGGKIVEVLYEKNRKKKIPPKA